MVQISNYNIVQKLQFRFYRLNRIQFGKSMFPILCFCKKLDCSERSHIASDDVEKTLNEFLFIVDSEQGDRLLQLKCSGMIKEARHREITKIGSCVMVSYSYLLPGEFNLCIRVFP